MNGSASRGKAIASALTAAVAVAFTCCPAPASAATGFGQIEGAGGCLLESGSPATSQCGAGEGIFHPKALAVAPDGTSVYVVGGVAGDSVAQSFGAIAILRRNPASGELTDVGCLSSDGTDGREAASGICAPTPSLLGADGVAVSADGRNVFVTASSSGSIVAFARNPTTGLLRRLGCFQSAPRPGAPCTPANVVDGSDDPLTNADDSALYVASPLESTISAFVALPASTGQSSAGTSSGASAAPTAASLFTALPGPFTANPCIAVNGLDGACAVGVAMKGVGALTLSPEGNQLYAVASASHAIDVFTQIGHEGLTETGCLLSAAPPGMCTSSQFMSSPTQLAISPDGRNAYVADASPRGGKIDTLSRNASNGQLTATGCVDYLPPPVKPEPGEEEHEEEPAQEAEKEPTDPCTSVPGLESVGTIAISADGSQLYAFGATSAVGFARDPNTGALSEMACASNADPRCSSLPDLSGVQAAAVSPNGRDVYVVTTNSKALLAFGVGASVTSTAAAESQRGIAFVDVACPAHLSRPCRGRVALTAAVARRTGRHKHRQRVLRVAIGGSGLFALGAGGSQGHRCAPGSLRAQSAAPPRAPPRNRSRARRAFRGRLGLGRAPCTAARTARATG